MYTGLFAEVTEQTAWWAPVLGLVATSFIGVACFALKQLIQFVMDKIKANEVQQAAADALKEGIAVAEDDFVRWAKMAHSDGKLTREEIKEAEKIAWEHAKKVVMGPAKDIVLSWTVERVSSLIKQHLK